MTDITRLQRRREIMGRVNGEADQFYDKAQELGSLAAESFRGQQSGNKKDAHRAQMTGLENIAETTMKVSDVLDYIKKQTARQPGWKMIYKAERLRDIGEKYQDYEGKCFGEILKNYIENDLEERRKQICSALGIDNHLVDFQYTNPEHTEDRREYQQVHLYLIRQIIRQLVVHYEYQVSELERKAALEKARES